MSGTVSQINAMKDANVRVACIHLVHGYVIMDGGMRLPITDMWDENHDNTNDPELTVEIQAGTDEIGYILTPVRRLPEYEWEH